MTEKATLDFRNHTGETSLDEPSNQAMQLTADRGVTTLNFMRKFSYDCKAPRRQR